ncbi:unnamed protein product [Porites lobata]|uniref:Uncharacterized protein n=1 Tax=Porites lobata TaxID=104759 RepID=A0ABN8PFB1_9CNID|nr:unnamed protein product [Porites lobata]
MLLYLMDRQSCGSLIGQLKGAVVDYIENFKKFLVKKLEDSGVYLIFDRYPDYSTKSVTRDARECTASRVFQLSEQAPLPPQNVILTVSKNKVQLMSMICSNITKDKTFHSQHSARHKLVITGSDLVPTEIHHGATKARHDMRTSHLRGRQHYSSASYQVRRRATAVIHSRNC